MELRTTFFRLFLGACLLLCLTSLPSLAQVIRYVKPVATGTGTGASWANASGNLQAMINAGGFSSNDQIWVMAGTYKPTTGGSFEPRNHRFILRNGVSIYGGFVGTETALNQRPAMSVTVPSGTTLSGDIGTPNNTADNTVTLIDLPADLFSQPTIDGFVLTLCTSNSTVSGQSRNGAIRNASSPTTRNCWFINNTNAQNGGAIANGFASGDAPLIENCRFESNTALQGGAIYNGGGSDSYSLKVLNSVFVSNTASQDGAIASAVSSYGTFSPVFTNCSFQSNVSTFLSVGGFGGGGISGGGGVMYSELTSGSTGGIGAVFTNCSFQGNRINSPAFGPTGFGALLFNNDLGSGQQGRGHAVLLHRLRDQKLGDTRVGRTPRLDPGRKRKTPV